MIGLSTSAGPRAYWNRWLKKFNMQAVEVNLKYSDFPLHSEGLKLAKKALSKYDLSVHSVVKSLLNEVDIITLSQQYALLSNIILASEVGAKQVVFHMPAHIDLEKEKETIKQFMPKAIDLAKEKGVQLILENNLNEAFSSAEDLLWALKTFPELRCCVDLGHLHVSNYGKEIEFIKKLKKHIIHVHVHDNSGKEDSHSALGKGNLDLGVIEFLRDNVGVRKFIVETHTSEGAAATLEILKKLLA